ncbi:MAG: ABC transporter ATP-binding protein [Ferruginibacter sp.]|nr:ABC transporter ATP-binding protein [Ferruginibacter sp.]
MKPVIKVENISKQYRLGEVGTGSIKDDFKRFRYRLMGKEDPFIKLGEANDRSKKSSSDYVWALRDINFELEQGDVLGIIGKNGAGKSTLLKILSRTTGPTTGSMKVKGRMASLLEVGTGFHPELSGRDNIFLNGAILGMRKKETMKKFDEIVHFSGVEGYIDTPVKRYSSGMYVRLAFAVAAHLEPEIMVVDEVLAVGDAEFQKKALAKMKQVAFSEGRTVIFVSHNMPAMRNLCNKGILLKNGNISFIGDIEKTVSAYLVSDQQSTQVAESIELSMNRTGSGSVTFADFYIENIYGERADRIVTGEDIVLVFKLKINQPNADEIDLGFSFEDEDDVPLGNLYSSFQDKFYNLKEGYHIVKCRLNHFPFAPGKIFVRGRIISNGEESDYLKDLLGILEVEMGDYYGTGSSGQRDWGAKCLFKGEWSQ